MATLYLVAVLQPEPVFSEIRVAGPALWEPLMRLITSLGGGIEMLPD